MSITITGIVTNGVVVPGSPLPEGACVEIHLQKDLYQAPLSASKQFSPTELRKLPREERQAVLAAAAALAEEDYRNDKDLTGFEAFSEELNDDSH